MAMGRIFQKLFSFRIFFTKSLNVLDLSKYIYIYIYYLTNNLRVARTGATNAASTIRGLGSYMRL